MLKADFNKDEWICDALAARYIIAHTSGTILRCLKADKSGNLQSLEYREVKFQTHAATGRVFFNMTWKGITKSVLVNRVIALRFLPNPLNLPQVNHIDGDKSHNYLYQPTPELRAKWGKYQLEWSSGSDNEKHAHRTGLKSGRGSANSNAKLDVDKVLEIRASHDAPELLAERYGVARSTIVSIQKRKSWSHV